MDREGWRTIYPSLRALWFDRPGVLHLHWPEDAIARVSLWRNRRKLAKLVVKVSLAKRLGAKIIWTVHNVEPHECVTPRFAVAAFYRWLAAVVDGCIYLTSASRREVWERRPRLRKIPSATIPHGLYQPVVPKLRNRATIRRELGVGPDQRLIVSFGMIRPYKKLDKLMKAFSRTASADFRLLVAGRVEDPALAKALTELARGDSRITFRPGFMSEQQLAEMVTAADLVVLPFQKVLNSGSVLYSISLGRRVLTSKRGSMLELARDFPDWVGLCDEITPEALTAALAEPHPLLRQPELGQYDWSSIASRTSRFFEEIAGFVRPGGRSSNPRFSRTPQ